jgi:hypothetical protein
MTGMILRALPFFLMLLFVPIGRMHKGDFPLGMLFVWHAYPGVVIGVMIKTGFVILASLIVIALHVGSSLLFGWLTTKWHRNGRNVPNKNLDHIPEVQ